MTAHAKLSASGSHRWIACPGSVSAEANAPKRKSSFFADEGSAAHELAEIVLSAGEHDCDKYIGLKLPSNNAFTVTPEMASHVQEYVNHVTQTGGHQWYEYRVDFSAWVPDGFGTSDAIAINDGTLHVIDLKYGKGIRVDAQDNTQGILYALGAFNEFEFLHQIDRVVITIVQPRMDHIDSWELPVCDLLQWGERIAKSAQIALQPDAKRNAGEKQCQFCAAKATCPEMLRITHETVGKDFDCLDQIQNLSDAQLRQALDHKRVILGWLDAVEDLARERLDAGETFPGYKLVAGRSSREWSNDESAQTALTALLGDNAYERKLLSPAKAEKSVSKEQFKNLSDLVIKRIGAPTLVPESDPRPSLGVSEKDFDAF